MEGTVRAAGGVVLRPDRSGQLEVALVHRPAYDDWSLPKGKLLPGESEEDGALREVQEETGMRCRLGRRLSSARYRDRKGRPKVVSYWVMTPEGGSFHPTEEVDELRWLPVKDAAGLLSYPHDRDLLREAVATD
ncbi:MAG: NUDIX hydrolase [Actinomycetota bacterium]|nr:NUDIX hydrolase [Actinomycetota bacterium]